MTTDEAEYAMDDALQNFAKVVTAELDQIIANCPKDEAMLQLASIVETHKSNTSSSGFSSKNLAERVWREIAAKKLSRLIRGL